MMARARLQLSANTADALSPRPNPLLWSGACLGELVKNGGAELVCPIDDIAGAIVEWVEANAVH